MAGRKSTTATAGKSKPKAKAGGRSAGLKSAGAKSVAKVKAVDQVVAAAKVARKSGKKTIPKKSTALKPRQSLFVFMTSWNSWRLT